MIGAGRVGHLLPNQSPLVAATGVMVRWYPEREVHGGGGRWMVVSTPKIQAVCSLKSIRRSFFPCLTPLLCELHHALYLPCAVFVILLRWFSWDSTRWYCHRASPYACSLVYTAAGQAREVS